MAAEDKYPGLRRDALFVETMRGLHRLKLTREWGTCQRLAVCIGVNPSKAGKKDDDPTINAMYQHCTAWDCERLVMLNLHTLVATDPRELVGHPETEVAGHLDIWREVFEKPDRDLLTVVAWGVNGGLNNKDRQAMAWLRYWGITPSCLNVTANGFPQHPLYIRRGTPLRIYKGR